MRKMLPTFLVVLCSFIGTASAASSVQQAFLVQNSGWMDPFYNDPSSPFKALVSAVIQHAAAHEDKIFVSAFNQSSGDNKSPVLLHEGTTSVAPERYLSPVGIARKNASGALADTDFQEAIGHVIRSQFQAKPGIIWIFTNNKNSPNNDLQTTQRNREFYRLVHLDPSIARTVAFPLRMPLKGKTYSANGMMVYALAYGEEASQQLAEMLDSGRLSNIFTNPPARLKPIDQDAVRLIPKGVTNSENMSVVLAEDGRTLVVDIAASKILPQINIKAAFQNLFYPYVISAANPAASLTGAWGTSPVEITPTSVSAVQPNEEREVAVSIPIPIAQVPSAWSPAALSAMGKQVQIPAVLEISLKDQKLTVSDAFKTSLAELFPGDPLSEMFTPPESVKSSSVRLPLVVRIQYPLMPLVASIIAFLSLLGGALALFFVMSKTSRFEVLVDGHKRSVAVKAFGNAEVRAADGTVVGTVKRALGRPTVAKVTEGHSVVMR